LKQKIEGEGNVSYRYFSTLLGFVVDDGFIVLVLV